MAQVKSLFGGSSLDNQRLSVPQSVANLQNQTGVLNTVSPTPTVKGNLFSPTAAVLGGLQAGQGVPAGTDFTSSAASIGTATLTGALAGSAGGPAGALIGAGVGLLTSSLNSFLSVRSENKRKREMEQFIKEQEAKQAKREALNRKDSFMQLKFQRSDIERTQAINAFQTKRTMLLDAVNSNANLKNQFIQTGIR